MSGILQIGKNYEQYDEIYYEEKNLNPKNHDKVLMFGPLSATLGELFDDGWFLSTNPYRLRYRTYPHKVKFYLTKDKIRYTLGNVRLNQYTKSNPPILSDFVKDRQQCQYICSSNPVDVNYWNVLTAKYPTTKRKFDMMVGNETLKEYLISELTHN